MTLREKARQVRLAFERGEIDEVERIARLDALRRPKGFWARVSWTWFGI